MNLTPFITAPHKSVTTENHAYWTLSLHYLPATPCLSALETSNTLCLFFCNSNQHVMCPTRLLKQHERLLLYNSILECVRAKKRAVAGGRNCYVGELRTNFDPGDRLRTPGEITGASLYWSYLGEKLTSVRISQTWAWAGMRVISWDFAYWILNPCYLCCKCMYRLCSQWKHDTILLIFHSPKCITVLKLQ